MWVDHEVQVSSQSYHANSINFSTLFPVSYNMSTPLFVLETYYSFVPSLDAGSSSEFSSAVPSAMLDLDARCHQRVSDLPRETGS